MKKSIIVVVNWSANNLAGSKNPLPLGMVSVNVGEFYMIFLRYKDQYDMIL